MQPMLQKETSQGTAPSSSVNLTPCVLHAMHKQFYLKCTRAVPDCTEERIGVFVWPDTEPGETFEQPCYPNITLTNLTATRLCMENGTWQEPDITNCSSG